MDLTVLEPDELYNTILQRLQSGGPEFSSSDRLVIESRIQKIRDLLFFQHFPFAQDDKERFMEVLQVYQASIAPIRRVPEQLLHYIFEFTVGDNSVLSVEDAPWSLIHVCRFWRQVGTAHGKLWSWVDFALEDPYVYPSPWLLRQWLSHSGDQPLDVNLTWKPSEDSPIDHRDVVEALIESSEKWRSFKLYWNGEFEVLAESESEEGSEDELQEGEGTLPSDSDSREEKRPAWTTPGIQMFRKLKNRVPLLESLDVCTYMNDINFPGEFEDAFVSAPALRSVRVTNCEYVDKAHIDWSNVTQLSHGSIEQDTTGIIYDILNKAPNLEEVFQTSDRGDSYTLQPPKGRTRIFTTNLKKLEIIDGNLLEHITAPNLSYLHLRTLPRAIPLLPSFLQRSKCRITSLDLFITDHSSSTQVVDILASIPTVTHLDVHFIGPTTTSEVIPRLVEKDNQLVPNLKFLRLSARDSFPQATILDLVESRFAQTQCEFNLWFHFSMDTATLDTLRRLRQDGLKIQLTWVSIAESGLTTSSSL